jgi:hypothetical protein
VEAQCKVVFQTLRKLTDEVKGEAQKKDFWDRYVRSVQFHINNKVSMITRSTPMELMLGPRGSNFPVELEMKRTMSEEEIKVYWDEVYNFIYPNLAKEVRIRKDVIKKSYDKKKVGKGTTFEIGNIVMLESPVVSLGKKGKKLEPRYSGPFIISKILTDQKGEFNGNYNIKPTGSNSITFKEQTKIPTNRLKLYAIPERVLDERKKKSSELNVGEMSGKLYLVELSNQEQLWYDEDLLPQSFKDEEAEEVYVEDEYNAEPDPDYKFSDQSDESEEFEEEE